MNHLITCLQKLGPGGRKCPCCNEFHGSSRKMLNRITRRRLNAHFAKEIRSELSE